MTKIVMVFLVVMAAMAVVEPPRSIAGEAVSELAKSDSDCSCSARHQSRMSLRELLKTMKVEQLAFDTSRTHGPHKTTKQ